MSLNQSSDSCNWRHTGLWNGLTDVYPASTGIDVQVRWRLIGQRVGDGRVAPLVIVVCRRPQKTSSHWSVLPQEVWEKKTDGLLGYWDREARLTGYMLHFYYWIIIYQSGKHESSIYWCVFINGSVAFLLSVIIDDAVRQDAKQMTQESEESQKWCEVYLCFLLISPQSDTTVIRIQETGLNS